MGAPSTTTLAVHRSGRWRSRTGPLADNLVGICQRDRPGSQDVRYTDHRRLEPALLPDEIKFVREKLRKAMHEENDPEMVGEALDTLKHIGAENDPLVLEGVRYLISTQRADGTWADEDDDLYTHFHSVWTSIDGLRDYREGGRVTRLPHMVSAAQCRAFAGR